MTRTIREGARAPAITLPDQSGTTRRLADHAGEWVLVYFYPKDDTPGCTVEACGIRDAWKDYERAGVRVLGISADSARKHERFAAKYSLPFTLLADEEKKVIQAYGAWGRKKFMGREFDGILRISYLVDPQGVVAKVYPKVKPADHAAEVLADVAALSAGGPPAAPRKKASAKKPGGKKVAKKTARKAPARKAAKKVATRKPATQAGAARRKS